MYCKEVVNSNNQNPREAVTNTIEGHVQVLKSSMGRLDLLPGDCTTLNDLLESNSGSKDSIKAIRKFMIDFAHSAFATIIIVFNYIQSLKTHSSDKLIRSGRFLTMLHALYVINDVLFKADTANGMHIYRIVTLFNIVG